MSAASKKRIYRPPIGFENLYATLKTKVGASEARRLVEADAALKRSRAAAQSTADRHA